MLSRHGKYRRYRITARSIRAGGASARVAERFSIETENENRSAFEAVCVCGVCAGHCICGFLVNFHQIVYPPHQRFRFTLPSQSFADCDDI